MGLDEGGYGRGGLKGRGGITGAGPPLGFSAASCETVSWVGVVGIKWEGLPPKYKIVELLELN